MEAKTCSHILDMEQKLPTNPFSLINKLLSKPLAALIIDLKLPNCASMMSNNNSKNNIIIEKIKPTLYTP